MDALHHKPPLLAPAAIACLLVAAAAWLGPAQARSLAGPAIQVEVIDDRGRPYRTYPAGGRHRAVHRAYLEAERGREYGIRIHNRSGRRVGLVIAVDGRNVLSGARSHLKPSEPMYVLGPRESATYDGWRVSRSRVHRFYFTEAGDTYAAAFGDRSAMGVIAVAAYAEKQAQVRKRQESTLGDRAARSMAPAAPGRPAEEAGTGFGRGADSPSVRVAFHPRARPASRHFLKYEWRSSLVRRGVLPTHPVRPRNRFWPETEFAPHPPGARGQG